MAVRAPSFASTVHGLLLAIYGMAVVTGTTGNFALPLPNMPSLSGIVLHGQGLCMSTAAALGLATRDGTQRVVGL